MRVKSFKSSLVVKHLINFSTVFVDLPMLLEEIKNCCDVDIVSIQYYLLS